MLCIFGSVCAPELLCMREQGPGVPTKQVGGYTVAASKQNQTGFTNIEGPSLTHKVGPCAVVHCRQMCAQHGLPLSTCVYHCMLPRGDQQCAFHKCFYEIAEDQVWLG